MKYSFSSWNLFPSTDKLFIDVFEYFRDRHHFKTKCSNKTQLNSDVRLSVFKAVNNNSSCTFVFRLRWFSMIFQTGCCLYEFGACCIAIFMHGFTAKDSPVHINGFCPLPQMCELIVHCFCRFHIPYILPALKQFVCKSSCLIICSTQKQ